MCLFENIRCFILADDVLILGTGNEMSEGFAEALDRTHEFLHDMGATVAPTKSFNFATHTKVKKWLENKTWTGIQSTIKVVDD